MVGVERLFFFQAEDGIRDVAVTGVQTCALPIYSPHEFIGPAIRKDLVNHQRLHLKSLRLPPPGEGESPGDVVDQQPVWFVLFPDQDRKSTRLNSSHGYISYAVFCLKKKKKQHIILQIHR